MYIINFIRKGLMVFPHKKDKDGILIQVKVHPRSSKRELRIIDDLFDIRLTAQPVDGEANKELINFLSDIFDVRKKDIIILKGIKSKNKLIKILGKNICFKA